MKVEDFNSALINTKVKQLDMTFWKFQERDLNKNKILIKPITIGLYNSSKIISSRFNKIIRF